MNPAADVDEAQRLLDGVEPTCEYRDPDGVMRCSTEATWLLRVSCGDSAFFCEGHRRTMESSLRERGAALYCAGHNGRRVQYDWVEISA